MSTTTNANPSIVSTVSLSVPAEFNFKNQSLQQAAQDISRIYSNALKYAEAKNREIACVLSKVKQEQSYKEDGFTSVADFAEKTFNIKQANAYSLAAAGDIYTNDKANDQLKALTPSKLYEVSSIDIDTLNTAAESGDISNSKTQKELRKYKEDHKDKIIQTGAEPQEVNTTTESTSTEVLDTYTAHAVDARLDIPQDLLDLLNGGSRTIGEWEKDIADEVKRIGRVECDVVKLPKGQPRVNGKILKKRTIDRRLFITHTFALAVEFHVYKPPIATSVDKTQVNKEELSSLLSKLSPDELMAMYQAAMTVKGIAEEQTDEQTDEQTEEHSEQQ